MSVRLNKPMVMEDNPSKGADEALVLVLFFFFFFFFFFFSPSNFTHSNV